MFFDKELQNLGVEETLKKYFYSIEYSIGSQLQPIVQLAFGIEQNLPDIISQSLAYYAASYLDVSNILEYCGSKQSAQSQSPDHTLVNKILFDLVYTDPRFAGKIEGRENTLQSSVKVLLKSQSELLKMYMCMWSSSYTYSASERLDMLIYTALTLIKVASRQSNDKIEMDWFLAGGQLLESALAIKKTMAHDETHLNNWVHIQFLSTLCTFVVQGRPMNKKTSVYNHVESISSIQEIMHDSFDDAKLMFTVTSVMKVKELYPEYNELCLDIMSLLGKFSKNGTWVKQGLGW